VDVTFSENVQVAGPPDVPTGSEPPVRTTFEVPTSAETTVKPHVFEIVGPAMTICAGKRTVTFAPVSGNVRESFPSWRV
jgi:hypothetical protein